MKKSIQIVAGFGALVGYASSTTDLTAASLFVLGLSSRWVRQGAVLAWRSGVRACKWFRQYRAKPSDNHGSARWTTRAEGKAAGLFGDQGLIIGKLNGRIVWHPSREASMIVFAPQGAGKGVGVVVPNLLTHKGSVICIDPKGENFAITGRTRLEHGPVWVLSMAEGAPSHCFNPFHTIETGSGREPGQAKRLAELVMAHEVTSESHWRDKAVQWLQGLILHVAERFKDVPERRNLSTVHNYATLSEASHRKLIEAMSLSPLSLVRALAAEWERALSGQEGASILSTMTKGTTIYAAGGRAAAITARSDFTLPDLFNRVGTSLYLQVPLGDMTVYAGWLRVMVGLANHASMTVATFPEHRPLFMLDEAATLGEIKELQDSIGQGPAYHQKVFIYQDMAQLKNANPGWLSVINNCHINMAFAVNDLDTAETLSRRLGDCTVATKSVGMSGGAASVLAHHSNEGQGEHGRRLMMPNEILHMDRNKALVSIVGLDLKGAMQVDRLRYFEERAFAGMADGWRDDAGGQGNAPMLARVFPTLYGPTLLGPAPC